MNYNFHEAYNTKGGYGTLEDIGKISPLAIHLDASVYSLHLEPAEQWQKPKALSGILLVIVISGQVLLRTSENDSDVQHTHFLHEDSIHYIGAKDNFNLEALYGKTKLLLVQMPSTTSYSSSVQIDLKYFSNSKEHNHVSKNLDDPNPIYN